MTVATSKAVKQIIKNSLIPVENALSTCIEKCRLAWWCEEKIFDPEHPKDGVQARVELGEIDWKSDPKVTHPGICVLSNGKLVMYRPLEVYQRHPGSRMAIVFTENYRPLKYPGAQSILFSLTFIRRNFGYWLKKDGHRSVSGNVALLGNRVYDNDNYYHFWTDVIADIWYIRQHLSEEDLPDYYLVPLSNAAWQWDVLSLCGIHESQVIPYDRHEIVSLDKLTIPVRDKGAVNLPSWLCRAMHDMCGWSPRAQRGERLIFVSRADAGRRRVVNEAAIRERLRDRGFEVHTLNGLSVAEQQQLFASAAIICAPHGAALTNLVWCGSGTVIIDLLSERHLIPCFRDLAEQNRLFYYPYSCKQVGDEASGINGDVVVEDYQVESVLSVVDFHAPKSRGSISAQVEKALSDKSVSLGSNG